MNPGLPNPLSEGKCGSEGEVSAMQASHLPRDGKLNEGVGKENVSRSVMSDCNPMDYNPPGSSVHGILQARVLKWAAISFSRASSRPRD